MSFQRWQVGRRESMCSGTLGKIYRRRFMKQNPFKTASTAIDPMYLPTSLRRDDIPVEACTSLMQERHAFRILFLPNDEFDCLSPTLLMPNAQQIKPLRNILKVKLNLLRSIPEMLGLPLHQLSLQRIQFKLHQAC